MILTSKWNISLLFVVLLAISCGGYEDLEAERAMFKKTDSLFATQRLALKKEMDSLCDLNFDTYFQNAIDSIKQKQIDEIQIILEK